MNSLFSPFHRNCRAIYSPHYKGGAGGGSDYKIIEQTIIGKAGPLRCEDGAVATNDFVAVVDGSTNKSSMRMHPDMSNGQYCMTLVKEHISRMPAETDCTTFCQDVTRVVRTVYERAGTDMNLLTATPTERMAASTAVYSRARQEVWLVGDCQCMIDGVLYDNPKPYEEMIAKMRSAYIRLQLSQGRHVEDFQEHDAGRDFILPVLIDSCRWQNQTFAVIDGFDIPLDRVRVIDVSGARQLVLATDGYPELLPTLADSEAALARQLADDPLCIYRHKATKGMMRGRLSFDDRCYIRMVAEGASQP